MYVIILLSLHGKQLPLLSPRLSVSLSYSLPPPVQKWGRTPGLASPPPPAPLRGRGWRQVTSPSPCSHQIAEAVKHFLTGTASRDLKVSGIPLGPGTTPQGKLDQVPALSCAPTCSLLIFQWFLSIALNGIVPPGDMMVHSGVVIMKDSPTAMQTFCMVADTIKPTNRFCSSRIQRSLGGV